MWINEFSKSKFETSNTQIPIIFVFSKQDALLIAIREDYVDGVECLLRFEEETHQPGKN